MYHGWLVEEGVSKSIIIYVFTSVNIIWTLVSADDPT